MKIGKRLRQVLSLFLTAILFTQLPVAAKAAPDRDGLTAAGPAAEEEMAGEPDILTELPAERNEYTKRFLLENGGMLAVQYAIPVHFEAEDGSWRQYDNRMQETADILDTEARDEEAQLCAENAVPNTEYKVIQSDKDIRLAKKAGNKKLITIEKDGNLISWGFSGVSKVPVEFTEPEPAGSGNDAFLNLTGVVQEAWYRDAFPDVDLQYLILPTGVKENIILKSADAQTDFVMEYKFHKLTAVQLNGKTVELRDNAGETVYTVTAPMMQDADGEWSDALTLSIEESKNNRLKIRVSADPEWLKDPARAFPVTVDPTFETSRSWGTVDSTTLVSGHPATAYGKGSANYIGSLYVGHEPNSSFGKTRALVRLNSLPQLSPGDVIVDSRLYLLQYASSAAIQVNAHRVTGSWTMAGATWNSSSSAFESTVSDYDITTSGVTSVYNSWNITRMTREWYDGTSANNGVMLIAPTESSASMSRVIYYASTYPDSVTVRPVFQLSYRSNRGLEGYWSYREQRLSGGAAGYVNDYSGNLVYQVPVMSESGARMPVSVNLTYNGYTSNRQFLNGASGLVTGNGWQTNLSQRCWKVENLPGLGADVIAALQAAGYKRIYIDEDGTVHYFKTTTDENTLEDEDGLGMTMKINSDPSSPYLIECADGSRIGFTAYGYLYKFVDASGNTATVDYSGANMTKITDGAGRVTRFTYAASGSAQRLTKVTDPSGRETTLTYSGNNLQRVTYPDGTSVQFAYSAVTANGESYSRISRVTDKDGTYLSYGYRSTGLAQELTKVTSVREYAADGTAGNSMSISYNRDRTTKFTYVRSGVTTSETSSFDNFGRTVSVLNADGSAATGTYTSTAGKQNNRLTHQAQGVKYVNNLLMNSSAENPGTGWSPGSSGAPSPTFSYDTTTYYLGQKALKIAQNSATTNVHGYYQDIAVSGGQYYTLSSYMKTENVAPSTGGGAGMFVQMFTKDGPIRWELMDEISGTHDWKRVKLTFYAEASITKVRVFCGIRKTTGTVWYDCIQLETGNTMNDYNMLQESNFATRSCWTGDNLGPSDGVNLDRQKGTLVGQANISKNIYQNVPVNRRNVSVTISGKAQANSVPIGYEGRNFALALKVHYSDSTFTYHVYPFNAETGAEQYLSATLTVPSNKQSLTVSSITFFAFYYKNAGVAWFDDVMMTFDETGTAYSYDSKGNVISAKDNAQRNSSCSYSSANELTKYTDEKNESYSYIYAAANAHRLAAARSNQLGNGFVYSYDAYGNVTGTQMGMVSTAGALSASAPYLQSGVTYNSTGNYVTAVTDQRGNTTSYSVNSTTGLINSVTDAKGNVTSYTYNALSLMPTSVTSGQHSISYGYDALYRMTSILHNGFTYGFSYDKFGNQNSVQVAGQTLSTNNYASANGNLTSTTYGNGDIFGYTYDTYDRITGVSVNGTQKYINIYNAKGQIAETKDLALNRRTEYTYDISGRLLRTFQPGFSDISSSYDVMNRVTGTRYTFAGQNKAEIFGYGSDGRKGTSTLISGITRKTVYDSLNRETSMELGTLTRTISYLNVSGNRTTTLPATLSYSKGGSTLLSTSYTYDANGNISSTTVGGTTYTYTYDAQNQLTSVTDGTNSASYSYDNGGNITSKTMNGITINYGYDTAWKDKLTSYNGQSITYDAIGNPLSYRDGMSFTWTGSQMDSATVNGISTNYIYGSDGIRTRKTVDSVTTDYFLDDSTILAEKIGSNVIWYIYDSDGDILGLINNGTPYYYLKNAQGDVVSIVDANMNVVGSYNYDAWGKILSVTGSIAQINPIRYRSYYYDKETNLYYLQSRYYDPETGRFLNADDTDILDADPENMVQYNLFAYGFNNPVSMTDDSGSWPSWATKLLIGTAVIAAAAILTVATAGTGTALACFAAGALKGAVVGAAVGAVSGAATGAVSHRIKTGSWRGAGKAALNGAADGYMSGAITGFISGGLTSNACFVAGTPVLSSVGLVAIETVQEGDSVWAEDPETGEKALKTVVRTFVNESDELIHVHTGADEIICTPEHPFYVPTKGWTGAAQLRAGDILVLSNGSYVTVEKIQHEILESPVKVYNFEVEDFHTYFVGESSVLVHNLCKTKNTSKLWDINKYSKKSIKFRFQGKKMTAQFDGKYYWSSDLASHGGSAFKVYRKVGRELRWVADADKYGNWIIGKAKSAIGKVIKL